MAKTRRFRVAALTAAFGFIALAAGGASAHGQTSSWGNVSPFRVAQAQGQATSSWGNVSPFRVTQAQGQATSSWGNVSPFRVAPTTSTWGNVSPF